MNPWLSAPTKSAIAVLHTRIDHLEQQLAALQADIAAAKVEGREAAGINKPATKRFALRKGNTGDWFTDSLGAIKSFESVAEVIEFRDSLGERRFDWYITKYPEGLVAEWNREHGAKGDAIHDAAQVIAEREETIEYLRSQIPKSAGASGGSERGAAPAVNDQGGVATPERPATASPETGRTVSQPQTKGEPEKAVEPVMLVAGLVAKRVLDRYRLVCNGEPYMPELLRALIESEAAAAFNAREVKP